jgi:membrane protease YdiL (CAAX protease family)
VPKSWSYLDFVLVFVGGLIGALVAVGVGTAIGDDEALLVLGLLGQYTGHLVTIWILSRSKDNPDLGFTIKGADSIYVGAGFLLQLILSVAFLPLTTLLFPEGDSAQQVGSALSGLESSAARLAAVFSAVVLAPLTEELMFRGVLMKAIKSTKKWLIILVTATVFSAFHITGLDPSRFLQAAAIVIPQLFIVGALLAWITLRTERLGPAIFLHSGFNLLAAVVLLMPPELLDSIS